MVETNGDTTGSDSPVRRLDSYTPAEWAVILFDKVRKVTFPKDFSYVKPLIQHLDRRSEAGNPERRAYKHKINLTEGKPNSQRMFVLLERDQFDMGLGEWGKISNCFNNPEHRASLTYLLLGLDQQVFHLHCVWKLVVLEPARFKGSEPNKYHFLLEAAVLSTALDASDVEALCLRNPALAREALWQLLKMAEYLHKEQERAQKKSFAQRVLLTQDLADIGFSVFHQY